MSTTEKLAQALREIYSSSSQDTADFAVRIAGEALAALEAEKASEQQAERVERNDPVSALAIRLLVAAGACTQRDANTAFHAACTMLEEEAQRQNVSLPWVVREVTPLTMAQVRASFEADSNESFADYLAGVRDAERAHGIGVELAEPNEKNEGDSDA